MEEERGSSDIGRWNEGWSIESSKQLDTMEESVSFFNELDTKKGLYSWWLISFLQKLETKNNYAWGHPFIF